MLKSRKSKKKVAGSQLLQFFICLIFIGLLAAGGFAYWRLSISKTPLSSSWRLKKIATNHEIEGYASPSSVSVGSTVDLHISCIGQSYKVDVYRMGWAGGSGAQLTKHLEYKNCKREPIPPPSPATGLINAAWPTSFKLNITSNWKSGIYMAKLTDASGYQNYVPFTVRAAMPRANFLFVHSITTDLAYNAWGGNSLYSGYTPNLNIPRAVEASLNRPFVMTNGNSKGSGNFLNWEYPMIKFLEKNNYSVDYATDIDIHEDPQLLLRYKTIVICGHDEYWSWQMRDAYQAAVNKGVNLAVFGANTTFRPIRFKSDPLTGQANRIIVNYKSDTLDPMTKINPRYSTPAAWRLPPLNRPESELLGIAYEGETSGKGKASGDLVVADDSSWIFQGTGVRRGDKIHGLVGYEYDRLNNSLPHPADIHIIFHSPLVNYHGIFDFADSAYFIFPGGGQVFNAGTVQWSWGLDVGQPTYRPQLAKVTTNILDRFEHSLHLTILNM